MVRWENKGVVMRYNVFAWARGGTSTSNTIAAHVVQRNDCNGNPKFYFYAPMEGGQSDYGISIGVAVADNPEGPFKDARGIPLIFLADTAGTAATCGGISTPRSSSTTTAGPTCTGETASCTGPSWNKT